MAGGCGGAVLDAVRRVEALTARGRRRVWRGTTGRSLCCEDWGMMNPFFLAQAVDNPAGVFFGLGIFGLILAVLVGLFWLWMLVDALTNSTLEPVTRIIWAAAIFFLPFVGALAYLFVGRKRRTIT